MYVFNVTIFIYSFLLKSLEFILVRSAKLQTSTVIDIDRIQVHPAKIQTR
jgi:hypothetical protein